MEPAWIFTEIPLVQNVIQQRFMAFGYLAAAVLLAVIMERTYRAVPDWRGALGALAVSGVALAPTAVIFSERLPFTMQAVVLPRWYSEVAPTLPPGRVLLTYPAPFSGIQSAMAWQAVLGMPFSLAGGGGPQGVERRAGTAAPGFAVLADLALGGLDPPPVGTPRQLAAVRHAMSVWEVNTVVVATDPALSTRQLGRDPVYAAAFMTAALGRAPTLEAGAWVWNNVQVGSTGPLELKAGTLATCTAAVEGKPGVFRATMQLPDCVAGGVLGTR